MKENPPSIKVSPHNYRTPHLISLTTWRNSVFPATLFKKKEWFFCSLLWPVEMNKQSLELISFRTYFFLNDPFLGTKQGAKKVCLSVWENVCSFVPWRKSSWTCTSSMTYWPKNTCLPIYISGLGYSEHLDPRGFFKIY